MRISDVESSHNKTMRIIQGEKDKQPVSICAECGKQFRQTFIKNQNRWTQFTTCSACRLKKGNKARKSADRSVTADLSKYNPYPWQQKFHNSQARFKIAQASSRSGKDYACLHEFALKFLQMLQEDRQNDDGINVFGWVIAPTQTQTEQNWRYLKKVLPADIIANVSFDKRDRWIETVNNGRIEFKSAFNEEALVGVAIDIAWITEAARIPDLETVWTNVERRLSSKGKGINGTGGIALINSSPRGRGYFYKLCQYGIKDSGAYDSDFETIRATAWDNPEEAWKRHKRNSYTIRINLLTFLKKYDIVEERGMFELFFNLVGGVDNTKTSTKKLKVHYDLDKQDFSDVLLKTEYYDIQSIMYNGEEISYDDTIFVVKQSRTYEESLKIRYSSNKYQEEILGEFADENGNQFKNFREKVVQPTPYFATQAEKMKWVFDIEKPNPNAEYSIGYDPAKYVDGGVVWVREKGTNILKKLVIFEKIDYFRQVEELKKLSAYYNNACVHWGRTGAGGLDDIIEASGLYNEGHNEQGNEKAKLVENYTDAINQGLMKVYETDDNIERMIREHEDYGFKTSSNGRVIYGNMTNGEHDDTVSAGYFAYFDYLKDKIGSGDDVEFYSGKMASANSNAITERQKSNRFATMTANRCAYGRRLR